MQRREGLRDVRANIGWHRAVMIELQKNEPKSLKTLDRAQNCTPSFPTPVQAPFIA
jgi:hypothetical protein